jgi:hypothetical protein
MSSNPYTVRDPLQDPTYKGEKTGEHLRDGPVESRGCTDFLCLLIFGGFWFGMISMAIFGYTTGDPEALLAPYDQKGTIICFVFLANKRSCLRTWE